MTFNLLAVFPIICNLTYAYGLGRLVQRNVMPVYVSRKIMHVVFLLLPFWMVRFAPRVLMADFTLNLGIFWFLNLALYTQVVRSKIPFFNTCFAALDRPEDRPFSLRLLVVQKISFLVIFAAVRNLNEGLFDAPVFYTIAFMTVVFGDGLAEPIGRTIRSYRYRTFSIFRTGNNFRTLAGSACVFLVSWLLIFNFYPPDRPEFILQLILVPFVATATEGFAPKTLDNALLFYATFGSLHAVAGVFGQTGV